MRALEKQPADRWQTGEEFRQALATEQAVPRARPPAPAPARRGGRGRGRVLAVGASRSPAGRRARRAGVNPRHSILVLPFDNLRDDRAVDWLRDGSVSMLGLNLSQWNDLTVVDHERLHDLLAAHRLRPGDDVGLDMARRLAREAGVWTVVLGDFTQAGDSLHLAARVFDVASGNRVDVARVDDRAGADVRPLFDELAAKLLDLSGAPERGADRPGPLAPPRRSRPTAPISPASSSSTGGTWPAPSASSSAPSGSTPPSAWRTTSSRSPAAGWWAPATRSPTPPSSGPPPTPATSRRTTAPSSTPTAPSWAASSPTRAPPTSSSSPATVGRRRLVRTGRGVVPRHHRRPTRRRTWTQAIRAFKRTLALDPDYALAYEHVQAMLGAAATRGPYYALVAADSFALTEGAGRPARCWTASPTAAAVRRARAEALATARSWVSTQPTTLRAHGAMVDAYIASGNFSAALAEVDRFRQTAPVHPELPFVEARIRFASGEVDRAAKRASHRARHGGAAGLPDLRGHAHGRERHRRRRQRLRLSGRPVERRQDDRPGRPGAARGDPAPRSRGRESTSARRGGAWRWASCTGRPASRRRRCARCGRAPRRRCGWRRPTSGPTWRTAAPRRRSGCSPARRRTAARSASTARSPARR